MIGYVTLGTNDIERAAAFYDELVSVVGAGRFLEAESLVAWAVTPDQPAFGITRPFDSLPASSGNGSMVAFSLDSNAKVDALHRKAIELGARDEGAPGPRGDTGFHAGYFRDLDGNKLNCYCWNAS
jgi:catechol 2,3-dioxygenase-like lactoylglutathione lyase family enzyme